MRDESADSEAVRLVELPSPFPCEPGTLRLLEPRDGLDTRLVEQLRLGTLGRPFLIDQGDFRNLFFHVAAVQSSMRLSDPDALVVAYTRKMMAFLLFVPVPRHVLMFGLGGGSIAKFCYRHLPQTRMSVIEPNADIIALRDYFLIPRDDARFEVIHEDGAAFLAGAAVKPDVMLVDAFDELGVAPSLLSGDFYRRAHECLAENGVLVMNLCGQKSRYAAHLQSLRAAFGTVRLVNVEADSNILVFALKQARVAALPDWLDERAVELEERLGLEFLRFLERLRTGCLLNGRADATPAVDSREMRGSS